MALEMQDVRFEGRAPTLSQLGDKIAETIGLPLIVRETPSHLKDHLHDLHGTIAFARYPKETIILSAYRPGGVRHDLERLGLSGSPLADAMEGADEPAGIQTVVVEGTGREPSLFLAAVYALRALGGHVDRGVNEATLDRYSVKTTLAELRSRRQRFHNRELLAALGVIVSLPIIIPSALLWFCWAVVTVPLRVRRAAKARTSVANRRGKPT